MAVRTDPNFTKEEKDRLRGKGLTRSWLGGMVQTAPSLQGAQSSAPPPNTYRDTLRRHGIAGYVGRNVEEMGQAAAAATGYAGDLYEGAMYGTEGRPPDPEVAAAAERAALAEDPAITRARTLADQYRADPGSGGLTRIVKNPDGSYTNMARHAQPGGEVRYYNQYGNREGVDPTARNPNDPNDLWSATNASAIDLDTDDVAMLRAVGGVGHEGGGIRSMDYAERGRQSLLRAQKEAELADMDPKERAMLMATQMKEGGLDERARMANLIALRGQDTTAGTAAAQRELDAAKQDTANANYANERYTEDPLGYAQRYMSTLRGLGADEVESIIGDPDNLQGQLATQGIIQAMIDNGQVDENFDPNKTERRGSLARFFTPSDYSSGSLGTGFDPEEIPGGGVSEQVWEGIVRGQKLAQSRARERARKRAQELQAKNK